MTTSFAKRGNPHSGFGLRKMPRPNLHMLAPTYRADHEARIWGVDAPLPLASANHHCVSSVLDQLHRGSCVNHALAQAVRSCQVRDGRLSPVLPHPGNQDWLCRSDDGNPDMSIDTGTWLRTGVDVFRKEGFADVANDVPYGDQPLDIARKPSTSYMRLAADQSDIRGTYQTDLVPVPLGSDADRILAVKRALAAGHFPIWAGDVSVPFAEGQFDPLKPVDACPPSLVDGGHCMMIVDYFSTVSGDTVFSLVNSWGTGWGSTGWFLATTGFLLSASELSILSHIEVEGAVS